ncbi:MAG: mechanosensitive ion channel family protein, partial [Dehalococcoidia bacterium]
WDGKVWSLQVTNTDANAVELRALMSARNSSEAWDLRCEIREGLVGMIQDRWPESLPRTRASVDWPRPETNGAVAHAS